MVLNVVALTQWTRDSWQRKFLGVTTPWTLARRFYRFLLRDGARFTLRFIAVLRWADLKQQHARDGPVRESIRRWIAAAWHGHRTRFERWMATALYGYIACLLIVWGLLRYQSDHWWLATVLLFGPRWPWGLAWPIFAIAAPWRSWRFRGSVALAFVILVFPIMQVCLPHVWPRPTPLSGLRIMTANVGGRDFDQEKFDNAIRDLSPDIIAIQEIGSNFKFTPPSNWTKVEYGDNLITSRWPLQQIAAVDQLYPPTRWSRPICGVVRVQSEHGDINVAALHLFSPRHGLMGMASRETILEPSGLDLLEEQIAGRAAESRHVVSRIGRISGPIIIVGDFNMPADSTIYRRDWSRYENAFTSSGLGMGHTVEIVAGGFPFRCRVDHILLSQDWWCRSCWVGPDIGSDHWPLIADLARRRE